MTYQARLSDNGMLALPDDLVRALGMRPGDAVSIDRSGDRIVIGQEDGRSAAVVRLRTALEGYSVDRFLAERTADWAE